MKKLTKLLIAIIVISQTASAQISGIVFRDFNANGIKDNTTAFNEPFVQGITVKAFDALDNLVGTTTSNLSGAYSFTGLTLPLRIEFSNLQTGDYTAPYAATGSKTNVQFYAIATTAANFAVNYPLDYAQTNPLIIVPVHDNGSGIGNTRVGLGSFLYDISGMQTQYGGSAANINNNATIDQIGTTWGVSYQKSTKRVFASSYLKTGASFADGPGYVYVLDYASATPSIVHQFNLQGTATANGGTIDLGSVTRTNVTGAIAFGAAGDYQMTNDRLEQVRDLDAFGKVGKMSFGDNDLTEDGKTMWLVNLYQRSLIKVDVSNMVTTTIPSVGAVNQYLLASLPGYPSVTTGVLRPWGLKFYRGKGYLGVVNDGSLSNRANLMAYVLSFDPNNITAGFTTELSVPLNYGREESTDSWKPWITTWVVTNNPAEDFKVYASDFGVYEGFVYAQPILSGIEFLPNGDMLLGFRDRYGDQMAGNNYFPSSGSMSSGYNVVKGDLLKAYKTGSTYTIEGANVSCPVNFSGTFGPSNNGEFFQDDSGDGASEGLSGSLAIWAGTNEIVTTTLNPKPPTQHGYYPYTSSSQGIHWNNLTNGLQTDWYQIEPSTTNMWGKSNGLGDIELLSNEAPLEIGNRIWNDSNGNGIQDAGEPSIANVSLELFIDNNNDGTPEGASIANTITNTNGEWYFNNGNITGDGDPNTTGIQAKLKTGIRYIVRPSSLDWNSTTGKGVGDLLGLNITKKSITGNGQPDLSDNDASITTGAVKVPQISFVAGAVGQNNHNLDFGFTGLASIGDKVWLDNGNGGGVANDGIQNGGELGVDFIPVSLYRNGPDGLPNTNDDVLLKSILTGSGGKYIFENLTPTDQINATTIKQTSYYVRIWAPTNHNYSVQTNNTDTDDETDFYSIWGNDFNNFGTTYSINLSSGERNINVDGAINLSGVLPIQITNFTALPSNNQVILSWEVAEQTNVLKYEVMFSTDSRNFSTISSVDNYGNQSDMYTAIHANVVSGANYYKIKTIEQDGKISFSDVKVVTFSKASGVIVYPNPVATGFINIALTGGITGKAATISIVSMDGKIMSAKQISNANQTERIDVNNLSNGSYTIRIATQTEVVNTRLEVIK
jgi:Secretion system C-terminal sorting domain/SdrD B-like domain